MEPVTIAIISTVIFGVVTTLSAFIRQLLLSRDKHLNDKAQQRALDQEAVELERLRKQMESNKRFTSHYKVLDSNKDDIQYLDQKIDDILNKKFILIQRYSELMLKESSALINGEKVDERKLVCDRLRQEIDREIEFYDEQLSQLQARRATFWDTHRDLQDYLLQQEKERNKKLDDIYERHTGLLEKIYIRHNQNSEQVTMKSIESGSQAFKLITAPLQMLLQFFNLSSNISPSRFEEERAARMDVRNTEREINGYDSDLDDGSHPSFYEQESETEYDEQSYISEPA
ncbi:hypothetical protein [Legionella impletisoli]|uniref:Uncharacterized protein n=1 Tax=Legionella impletisoli TaxID=343510 RepID=A0A917JQB2_9GAMM|nr:hypothetical protein [Legionella impletisoli]GGI81250.1 hypothetical protein GCM10007966_07190 [Legionella impletisoli]